MELSDQLRAQAAVPAGNNLGIHWIWGWMGFGVERDVLEKEVTLLSFRDTNPRFFSPKPSQYKVYAIPAPTQESLKGLIKPHGLNNCKV